MSTTPPVFAIHGWAFNAAVFEPLAAAFERDVFFSCDLAGHGRRRGETLGRDPDAIVRALLEKSPPRAVWLGWSLGGLLALGAALAAPERITALVLVATGPAFAAGPGWPLGVPRERLERMSAALTRDPEAMVAEFLALTVVASEHRGAVLQAERDALARGGTASASALADGLALLAAIDYRAALARIAAPALVIAGGRDRVVRPEAAEALAAGLLDSRLHLIDGAGHAPFLSHPLEFREVLRGFLATAADG